MYIFWRMLLPARARRRFLPAVLVTLLSLGAVTIGAVVDAQAKKGSSKAKAPAAGSTECKTDGDCVAVIDECCPCSQGGKQRAILKKEQAGYEKDRKGRCKDQLCTEMMSQDPSCSQRPVCLAGICELADAP
jgi:hypothetical protein